MSPERKRLALRAMRTALRLRQKHQIPADQPCCAYDLAEKIGVEVRFADIPSAEGIYSPGKPVIVVSALRPPVRGGLFLVLIADAKDSGDHGTGGARVQTEEPDAGSGLHRVVLVGCRLHDVGAQHGPRYGAAPRGSGERPD